MASDNVVKLIFFPLFTLFVFFGCSHNNYEKAVDAYQKGDFSNAYRGFLQLATQGDSDSQYWLGILYDSGKGVSKDTKEAAYWMQKSAEQNNALAQGVIGCMYYIGSGVRILIHTGHRF